MADNSAQPVIGITMGDPVGVGPELICQALADSAIYQYCRPMVIGDTGVLAAVQQVMGLDQTITAIEAPAAVTYEPGRINVLNISRLNAEQISWGHPTPATSQAMIDYITTGIDKALAGDISALVTGPINKTAMKMAKSRFHGHTELIAHRTGAARYAMMMAGRRLRIVLVTIHIPLRQVPQDLSQDRVLETIKITDDSLKERFGIAKPRIAVAGLNPHAGEGDMFGTEESGCITPAVQQAVSQGILAEGPFPPDTLFCHAVDGPYDAVVCMYHDQGLIPFKMIHFSDGINTTLGLPIIRTSVDHGTAYDIAGKGIADPGSLKAAIRIAADQAIHRQAAQRGSA